MDLASVCSCSRIYFWTHYLEYIAKFLFKSIAFISLLNICLQKLYLEFCPSLVFYLAYILILSILSGSIACCCLDFICRI